MKVAVVYTSTTPELIQKVAEELEEKLKGLEYEVVSYENPGILQCARENNGVTPECTKDLVELYQQAASDGADVIMNACSSVGDIAKVAAPMYEMMGIAFVRIDEKMAMEAVKVADRIGVVATLPTTLEPTKRLIQDCATAQGKNVVLVDALAEGAFGMDQEQFKQKLIDTGRKVASEVDVLLFAQGSMAYAEQDVSKALGLPVFSSVRFGAEAVKERF